MKLRDLRIFMVENGMLADDSSKSEGGEPKAVTDAKSRLNAATNELNEVKSSITTHQEDLTKDYGPDDVFRSLKEKCVTVDSGEYEYEMCWMGKTTHKSKKGGSNTGMGTFTHFEVITADEEIPADGKGLGSGERLAMVFENGQHCWNGPARSTTVIMACSEKDEIWKVVEAEKCVYRMELGTPAVCNAALVKPAEAPKGKDEL